MDFQKRRKARNFLLGHHLISMRVGGEVFTLAHDHVPTPKVLLNPLAVPRLTHIPKADFWRAVQEHVSVVPPGERERRSLKGEDLVDLIYYELESVSLCETAKPKPFLREAEAIQRICWSYRAGIGRGVREVPRTGDDTLKQTIAVAFGAFTAFSVANAVVKLFAPKGAEPASPEATP